MKLPQLPHGLDWIRLLSPVLPDIIRPDLDFHHPDELIPCPVECEEEDSCYDKN
jgi:hypothetical protein